MAADETADAVAISGLGTIESIKKAIHECQKQGIYSILDMMNVDDFTKKLKKLNKKVNNPNKNGQSPSQTPHHRRYTDVK